MLAFVSDPAGAVIVVLLVLGAFAFVLTPYVAAQWVLSKAIDLVFPMPPPGVELGARKFRSLDDLLAEVERATGLEGAWLLEGKRLEDAFFSGEVLGRRATLSFFEGPIDGVLYASFAVDADRAWSLKVTREAYGSLNRNWDRLAPAVTSGDAEFDHRYRLQAYFEDSARSALAKGLRNTIDRVFETLSARELELDSGKLKLAVPVSRVDVGRYRAVLEHLAQTARGLDRVPLRVTILGGERRALSAQGGGARCAYCHEGVTGEEPDLVACRLCATVLHEACWEENRRCPVLGCAGVAPERAPPAPREGARAPA